MCLSVHPEKLQAFGGKRYSYRSYCSRHEYCLMSTYILSIISFLSVCLSVCLILFWVAASEGTTLYIFFVSRISYLLSSISIPEGQTDSLRPQTGSHRPQTGSKAPDWPTESPGAQDRLSEDPYRVSKARIGPRQTLRPKTSSLRPKRPQTGSQRRQTVSAQHASA